MEWPGAPSLERAYAHLERAETAALSPSASRANLRHFPGTGACGAFTTFSSFAYETVRLAEGGKSVDSDVNSAGNLLGALAAVALAWAATTAV